MRFYEHSTRSLAKTITYRILILISTFIIFYIFTKDIQKTTALTLVSNIINALLYYLHERFWNYIHWGKHKK
ncbi:DUF2061 domain-containing protein [Candidatus Daviesbacteria bacterium]|nr:DUF2061 domain-containing protein [Candidatus Daviesbacteria bacterium]